MVTDSLGVRDIRQVYLVTYSQADLVKFPSRKEFADALVFLRLARTMSFNGVVVLKITKMVGNTITLQ